MTIEEYDVAAVRVGVLDPFADSRVEGVGLDQARGVVVQFFNERAAIVRDSDRCTTVVEG